MCGLSCHIPLLFRWNVGSRRGYLFIFGIFFRRILQFFSLECMNTCIACDWHFNCFECIHRLVNQKCICNTFSACRHCRIKKRYVMEMAQKITGRYWIYWQSGERTTIHCKWRYLWLVISNEMKWTWAMRKQGNIKKHGPEIKCMPSTNSAINVWQWAKATDSIHAISLQIFTLCTIENCADSW